MKIAALMLSLVPASALAHPGHENGGALGAGLRHLFTQPDHLALLAGPVALAVGLLVWLARRDRRNWLRRVALEQRLAQKLRR
jgi:hydrogenase/urease accessory protein HupE